MAEMEKKVRSIRADDEVYAKFKEICEQAGGQNEALSALISSYEFETAKSMLPGQATSIDDFKSRIEGVIRAYISALDLSVSAEEREERVREDYKQRMNTQVKTIEDLQTRNEQLTASYTALLEQAEQAQTTHQAEVTELRTMCDLEQDKAVQAEKQREQAEKIANMATEQVEQLKARGCQTYLKSQSSR